MVVSFYIVCGLGPGVVNKYLDPRLTDDKFCIAFQTNGASDETITGLQNFFAATGAEEVNSKII